MTAATGVAQVHGRCQGTGDSTFYIIYITPGDSTLHLAYYNGSLTDIDSASTGSLSVGTNYKLTLSMDGSSISGKLEDLDAPSTLATVSATDSTITGSGVQAISVGQGPNDPIDYDNFSAVPNIEAISVSDTGSGADSVAASQTGELKTVSDTGGGGEAISVGTTVPVSDASLGADLVSGPPMDPLVLLERFEGTLADWTLDESGGTVSIQTVDEDEKMVLSDASASAVVSAARNIVPPDGVFLVEADMHAASGAVGRLELLDPADNVLASVKVDGGAGQGAFDTDQDTPSTFSWTAATYRMVVLVVDTATGRARCFYTTGNGTAPSDWTEAGAAKVYSRGAAISQIRFITDAAATGEVRVDEVKVFRATDFALGDSNTAGHGIAGTPAWNPNPEDAGRKSTDEDETHSWPYRLGQRYASPRWCANRGVDTDRTGDGDGRVAASVIDQGAERCFVMLGTNDIKNGVPLATIEANLSSITSKLDSAGVEVVLCNVPPSNTFDATQNGDKASLNAWMEDHASANGYGFIDIHAAVQDSGNPDNIAPAYDNGDGLHFNSAGQQQIADTIYQTLLGASVVDGGAGADDVAGIFASVGVGDTATGLDEVILGLVQIADLGSGADFVGVEITGGATLQDVYDLVLTRLASADYTAPDNAGIASILTIVTLLNKYVRNKKEIKNIDGTNLLIIYDDDDGSTELIRKTLKDPNGADITAVVAGALALENASSV